MPKEAKIDARVDGELEFKYHWANRNLDAVLRGKILELEPNRWISYTWDAETTDHKPRISGATVTWVRIRCLMVRRASP
jgi:uncharacterized protein YndB with AHSA1/START domain